MRRNQKRLAAPIPIHAKPYANPTSRQIRPSSLVCLQRMLGNQGFQHHLQPKLQIGLPDDKFEQEADRIAYQVMHLPEPQVRQQPEKGEKDQLQTDKVSVQTSVITTDLESEMRSQCPNGRPLSEAERNFFEPRFGVDFSGVRIHSNQQSKRIAKSVNARAFTLGQDIYFSQANQDFSNSEARNLFAHELTHTIQQKPKNTGLNQSSDVLASRTNRPVQNTGGSMIQRWGLGDHETLTENAVNKLMPFFPEVTVNRDTIEMLKDYSKEMDVRFPAICFNLPAVLIGSHEALVEHYTSNQAEAKNHGEGGLYMHDMATAREINLSRQKEYEDRARKAWETTQGTFGSMSECFAAKDAGGRKTLEALGYALHVAQDRGAHGEGAIGMGHDRQDFEPDDPSVNTEGWHQAQNNTEILMLNAIDILIKILGERWSRTCSFSRPAEVRTVDGE